MKIPAICATLFLAALSAQASSQVIDDFASFESTAALQQNWGSFGAAATAGAPVLEVGKGIDGANAARYALDWRGAGNTNANARRSNVNADLSGFNALSVVAYIETRATFVAPADPTVFKVAIQGANGDIWQTPTSMAPTISSTDYQSYVFLFSELNLVVVGPSGVAGTLNDTLGNVSQIRLRFENTPGQQSREDVYFATMEAITVEGGGGEGLEIPHLQISTAVEIHFDTLSGQFYQIQRSSDLLSWENEGDLIAGTGEEISRLFSVRQDPPKAFFRVLTTTE